MKNFDSIEEALNVDTEVVENDKIEPRKNQLKKTMNIVMQIYFRTLRKDKKQ